MSSNPFDSQYRDLSLWHDTVPDDLTPRKALPGDIEVDVAIIGGGLTGLWSAYYLKKANPALRIAVLEKHVAGFGASGRNGGWCSSLFPAAASALERRHGFDAAVRMRQAMIDTVDEVGRVTAAEGIDCDFAKGGTLLFIRSAPQLSRARAELAEAARFGVDQLRQEPGQGVVFDPTCATLHPAKLVRGLARTVERLGVTIYENTEVTAYRKQLVETDHGEVACRSIVVATEAYGCTVKPTHRSVLPLYSLMIATEPLPDALWNELGIEHGQSFADYRHLLIYGQRTVDNRFAFGGRGARYHWGSAVRPEFDRVSRVFSHLRTALTELFPQVGEASITHRWGGPIGVNRDWHPGVRFDRESGIASAGGYVGDGLSTTNLAGRTIAALIEDGQGIESVKLRKLPWVGHRSPDWEPEPFRFIGANLGLVATGFADTEERLTGRPSVIAKLMAPLTGH